MPLCLYFIAFDFLYVTGFFCGRNDEVNLVPKYYRIVQHALDTQHVFFTSFRHDSRLQQMCLRTNCSLCVAGLFARTDGNQLTQKWAKSSTWKSMRCFQIIIIFEKKTVLKPLHAVERCLHRVGTLMA